MRFSLRFTFTVIYLPAPFVGKITLTSVPVLRLGKVQRSAESRRPFAHNIQPVMSRRLAGFANPDTVIANADAVGAVSRRHAADGYLAGGRASSHSTPLHARSAANAPVSGHPAPARRGGSRGTALPASGSVTRPVTPVGPRADWRG